MNLDEYKEGLHDDNSPMNQKELPKEFKYDCVDDALFRGDIDEALKLVQNVRKQIGQLRELCKQTNNDGDKDFLINRLTKIYNAL